MPSVRARTTGPTGLTPGAIALPDGPQDGDGNDLSPGPVTGFVLPASGVHEFVDSKTYEPNPPPANQLVGVTTLKLQARNAQRPYVRVAPSGGDDAIAFVAAPRPAGFDPQDPANDRTLELDGLWLGLLPVNQLPEVVADIHTPATPIQMRLVLDGVFDRVVLRHMTLDPGGERARLSPTEAFAIPAVVLELAGQVDELILDRCVTGPIREIAGSTDPCSAGTIRVCDSIVQSMVAGVPAIEAPSANVHLERSTVFGDVRTNRLWATEALVQGRIRVVDNQNGCFRFSATSAGATVRLPPRFESHVLGGGSPTTLLCRGGSATPGSGS